MNCHEDVNVGGERNIGMYLYGVRVKNKFMICSLDLVNKKTMYEVVWWNVKMEIFWTKINKYSRQICCDTRFEKFLIVIFAKKKIGIVNSKIFYIYNNILHIFWI